jgi:ABC-2 type transport system permease protein
VSPPAEGDAGCRPLTEPEEGRLFWRLRAVTAWAIVRGMLATARLRLVLVVVLSAVFWLTLYLLFREGFAFLASIHANVAPLLFNTFFSTLLMLVLFSTGILAYAGLYTSREAKLLLTLPARPAAVFTHIFREALWFAGWGFILLGSPMLVAFGRVRGAGWPYMLLLVPFMVSFITIPATLGAMLALAIVAWLPRYRLQATAGAALMVLLALAWLGWSALVTPGEDALTPPWFEQVLARLEISQQRLLPSWWLSTGLLEAAGAHGPRAGVALGESLRFLAVLVSNALMLQVVARWIARHLYRTGFSRLTAEIPSRRPPRQRRIDAVLAGTGDRAASPVRLLLVKDIRLFRRDVTQWSQLVVFVVLLGFYCLSMRAFHYSGSYAPVVGFLNLTVIGLVLSTFTTKFVYPMISLEGRRFWILGLLPVRRDEILWSKFVLATVGTVVPCLGLVLVSDLMLALPGWVMLVHSVSAVGICLGLSGIAVGLGAWMPNLRESSAAKIAAGFGGTLSLVLGSLLVILVVALTAVPTQLTILGSGAIRESAGWLALLARVGTWRGVAGGLTLAGVICALAVAVPMIVGREAFRRLEP